MTACIHPVEYLSHTVTATPYAKTHALYKEHHRTVCTQCMSVISSETITSAQLQQRYEDSK